MVLALLLLLMVLAYVLLLEFLRRQLNREEAPPEKPPSPPVPHMLSLLVVVRNEAQNLPALFEALARQDLDAQALELHLIDDHSSDGSLALAEAFQARAPFPVFLHALRLSKKGTSPKKAAISQVLPHCRGSVVVVTDGDCQPAAGWLSTLCRFWQQHQPVFVSGPVRYMGERGFFDRLQALDFAALIGVGGAMLKAGRPGMCNAANMAFSREAFYAVGGYAGNEEIPSGDDEFLLQKLAARYPDGVYFLNSPAALVSTQPCAGWQAFVAQRKRWAGKWRLHKHWTARLPAVAVFAFYLLLALSGLLPLLWKNTLPLVLLAWALKAVADYRFLHSVLKLLGKPLSPALFLVMELVYPLYVLFFAVAANRGGFRWKDRSYRYSTTPHE
jgi:poly-beta-1,6-N-acetyl-D-glucosamine synthase